MSTFLKRKEEAMKELKDLVVGDEVVAYDKYDNRRIAIVERVTKTLVVVNNIKYRKSDGLSNWRERTSIFMFISFKELKDMAIERLTKSLEQHQKMYEEL